jgi:hypothetical protein
MDLIVSNAKIKSVRKADNGTTYIRFSDMDEGKEHNIGVDNAEGVKADKSKNVSLMLEGYDIISTNSGFFQRADKALVKAKS